MKQERTVDGWVRAFQCVVAAMLIGLVAHTIYSLKVGLTIQNITMGPILAWFAIYLFCCVSISLVCGLVLLWMALTGRKSWRQCGKTLIGGWLLVILGIIASEFLPTKEGDVRADLLKQSETMKPENPKVDR
jgi:hypothetical protein